MSALSEAMIDKGIDKGFFHRDPMSKKECKEFEKLNKAKSPILESDPIRCEDV